MYNFGRHSLVARAEHASIRIQKLFNFPKLHTMHVNGDEIFASFPDIHKDLALNNKLKRPFGYTPA
jgi:hypothetical protein